ncbi:Rpr2-domain-containing protein [Massarina eburnea CBS 473.64]|uniref:Rpr2-domain-containing protein n=1 Tax=Massarina eburnea CBS 473.64 TaxID=1395130 RepID=A0A6A6RLD6_9PLEO|nr:Rpr2-domain-containing protein [Massarina eburnea CBS 473.64]
MAKDKLPKTKGVLNKHLHARTAFLYQAATYLTLHGSSNAGLALQLGSDLQTVSRKGQIRVNVDVKRNICKTCNSVLVPGRTATHEIENHSKGAKKPWADVLVVGCNLCGSEKRFPVGAKRQQKKTARSLQTSIATTQSPSRNITCPPLRER